MKGSDRLNLQVTDFGPIVDANVDLRPFTLFIGPSNTGKSYLALLIRSLHRRFCRNQSFVDHRPGKRPLRPVPDNLRGTLALNEPFLSNDSVDYVLKWAQQVISEQTFADETPLPERVATLIRSWLKTKNGSDELAGIYIASSFGLDSPTRLVRQASSGRTQITFRRYVEGEKEDESPFVHRIDIPKSNRKQVHLTVSIPSEIPLYLGRGLMDYWLERAWKLFVGRNLDPEEIKPTAHHIFDGVVESVYPQIIGAFNSPAFHLPAGRTGFLHTYRLVLTALVKGTSDPNTPIPRLSSSYSELLQTLISLGDAREWRESKKISPLATYLEKTILKGEVWLEGKTDLGGFPSFSYRPTGWKENLPLMQASSMVSELAPVVLYLRHIVRPGDVLIIEEPEAHLHPGMQVEFTRILAAAVRNGIRIIVTTHSEWILEELANLVNSSALSKDKQKTLGVADFALEESEVGAWLFQPKKGSKGSFVGKIQLDPESGTYEAGYDEVAAALHNRWADISSYSE